MYEEGREGRGVGRETTSLSASILSLALMISGIIDFLPHLAAQCWIPFSKVLLQLLCGLFHLPP